MISVSDATAQQNGWNAKLAAEPFLAQMTLPTTTSSGALSVPVPKTEDQHQHAPDEKKDDKHD